MGFPVKIFCQAPDEEWICPICQDVFESPVCCPCGHSFCRPCLETWLVKRRKYDCPTCRRDGLSLDEEEGPTNCHPCGNLERIIAKAKVRCMDNSISTTKVRRRRLNNGEAAPAQQDAPDGGDCDWTGMLSGWKKHCEDECPCSVIPCSVAGCSHVCRRTDMQKHMVEAIAVHVELLVDAKTQAILGNYEQRLDEIQREREREMTEMQVNHFLRQWISRKPAALFDFCVYSDLSHMKRGFTTLLVGIPGPKNTPWEGGLFPVLMIWNRAWHLPPKCSFPRGFHHINVCPSGFISLSILHEEEGWRPTISIHEMLFSIQALLAHPNPNSPSQAEAYNCYMKSKDDYNSKARELAQTYSASYDFLAAARAAFGEEKIPRSMELVHDQRSQLEKVHDYKQDASTAQPAELQAPTTPPELPSDAECRCSCCAWSTAFWDENREMRHFFGVGA